MKLAGSESSQALNGFFSGFSCLMLWEPLPIGLGLSLEEVLVSQGTPFILVWRQPASVIVGRRLAWCEEVDCGEVGVFDIPVLRRLSGGGAVYHDPGNINISIIYPWRLAVDIIYKWGLSLVLALLSRLGLQAEIRNYNDVAVNGWKVSGSSAYTGRSGSLFHATLLVEADTSLLYRLLKPPLWRIRKEGLDPVKYKPRNLASIMPGINTWGIYREIRGLIHELTGAPALEHIPAGILGETLNLWRYRYGVKGAWIHYPAGDSGWSQNH